MSCYTFSDVEFCRLQLLLKDSLNVLRLIQEVKNILIQS